MTKQGLMDSVQKNWEVARLGYVAAIFAAAQNPTAEALENIAWYERRMDELHVLRLKVEANIEEDSHL
jgi:hypothetical protein